MTERNIRGGVKKGEKKRYVINERSLICLIIGTYPPFPPLADTQLLFNIYLCVEKHNLTLSFKDFFTPFA